LAFRYDPDVYYLSYGKLTNQLILVNELLYFWATFFVKVSIALTLLRIIIDRAYRYFLYTLLLVGLVITVFAFFWALFFCTPASYFWDHVLGQAGDCKPAYSLRAIHYAQSSWVLIADILLGLIFPLLLLWSSLMERRMKILVWCLLAFGSVSVALLCQAI
jgi:hypothetical protein